MLPLSYILYTIRWRLKCILFPYFLRHPVHDVNVELKFIAVWLKLTLNHEQKLYTFEIPQEGLSCGTLKNMHRGHHNHSSALKFFIWRKYFGKLPVCSLWYFTLVIIIWEHSSEREKQLKIVKTDRQSTINMN